LLLETINVATVSAQPQSTIHTVSNPLVSAPGEAARSKLFLVCDSEDTCAVHHFSRYSSQLTNTGILFVNFLFYVAIH